VSPPGDFLGNPYVLERREIETNSPGSPSTGDSLGSLFFVILLDKVHKHFNYMLITFVQN